MPRTCSTRISPPGPPAGGKSPWTYTRRGLWFRCWFCCVSSRCLDCLGHTPCKGCLIVGKNNASSVRLQASGCPRLPVPKMAASVARLCGNQLLHNVVQGCADAFEEDDDGCWRKTSCHSEHYWRRKKATLRLSTDTAKLWITRSTKDSFFLDLFAQRLRAHKMSQPIARPFINSSIRSN